MRSWSHENVSIARFSELAIVSRKVVVVSYSVLSKDNVYPITPVGLYFEVRLAKGQWATERQAHASRYDAWRLWLSVR